jgi:hypothetical protein
MALRTHNLPFEHFKKRLCWNRWSDVSSCEKAMWTHYLHSVHRKKRLGRNFLCVLRRRVFLRTHNLPSGRLEKRLWCSWWSVVSSCRNAIGNHFLHPRYRKKRLGRSSLISVLNRRMVLRTHYLLYGRLKKLLWWSRWSDVLRCRRAMRTSFCILGILKSDLGIVA